MTASARAAISWSAGKDSCLALLRARESGFAASTFVTMCEPDGTSKSHALPAALVAAQVAAFGGDWLQVSVASGAYASTFDATLRRLRDTGHTHMVFGDIDLQAHRDWLEVACAKARLQPVFPLWGERRDAVAAEVIARGSARSWSRSMRAGSTPRSPARATTQRCLRDCLPACVRAVRKASSTPSCSMPPE